MPIVNLTPHKIVILAEDGKTKHELEPVVPAARVATSEKSLGSYDDGDWTTCEANDPAWLIPLKKVVYDGEVENLPEPSPGRIYVVSGQVLARVHDRPDVFAPDTGKSAIRENGQIVAVRGLIQ
jgi:hypothetical protein